MQFQKEYRCEGSTLHEPAAPEAVGAHRRAFGTRSSLARLLRLQPSASAFLSAGRRELRFHEKRHCEVGSWTNQENSRQRWPYLERPLPHSLGKLLCTSECVFASPAGRLRQPRCA